MDKDVAEVTAEKSPWVLDAHRVHLPPLDRQEGPSAPSPITEDSPTHHSCYLSCCVMGRWCRLLLEQHKEVGV